nr:hypothetical protein [Tanacetum cinerariifolium]
RSYFPPSNSIPRHSRRKSTSLIESEIQTNATMEDNRTMAHMLQAPIEGYEDAIVVPPINANNFELNQTLINLVQSNQFTGRQDPHNHLCFFNKVTSTFRNLEVPNTIVKLLLFPFSLEGEARIWLDKEPPRSILTWEDLVSKFINQFFPPFKTTKNISLVESEIQTNATMADNHTMAQMLQATIEGYEDAIVVPPINANNFELKQTFINLVQSNQFTGRQDPHNHLRFFNKVTSTFRHPKVPNTTQIAAALEDKLDIRMNRFEKSLNEMKNSLVTPTAPLKAVTKVCITCGSNHSYNPCPLTRGGNDFPALIEGYEDAIVVPPINANNFELKQTFINLDALDSAAGGNFLDKIPRECLSIIESKSKVRYSRSRVTDIAAALEDKLDIRMNRFEKSLNEMKNSLVTPTAPLKAVTEVCITCGSNHSYNQCPLTRGGNDFPVFHDNIQQFQTAAVGNFI